MSEELKITKERVLSAAGKCEEWKEGLKELFPEAFEEKWEDVTDKVTKLSPGIGDKEKGPWIHFGGLEDPYQGVCVLSIGGSGGFKIEDGRIWRKKS